jgi:hypothetical protein
MLDVKGSAKREPGERSVANRMFLNATSGFEIGPARLITTILNDDSAMHKRLQ